MGIEFIWLAICVLIAYISYALSGFGGNIIVITLAAHLYPIETLLPVVVPLTFVGNIYITARYSSHISKPVLLRNILPAMGTGFIIGMVVFSFLHGEMLKKVFGILVVLLSFREIVRLVKSENNSGPMSGIKSFAYIFSAGIIQGIYASGGPLLVYAVSKLNLPKSIFRSTLSAVWLAFHAVLTSYYYLTGRLALDSLKTIIILLPVFAAGTLIGEKLHTHINEYHFKVVVFAILLVAGLAIVIR